jgi:glycosyltransferase involved in cell wall biosynthesis
MALTSAGWRGAAARAIQHRPGARTATKTLGISVGLGLLFGEGWLIDKLLAQHGRVLLRLERLEARLDRVSRDAAPPSAGMLHPPGRDRDQPRNAYSRARGIERGQWDSAMAACGGTAMQSWRWGELLQRLGFEVVRVRVDGLLGTGMAQVVFEDFGHGLTAHIPHGPAILGHWQPVARELFDAVAELALRHGAVSVTVEPDAPLPPGADYAALGFVPADQPHYGPARTAKVELRTDDALLEQMRSGTRKEVRLGQRHGVTVTLHDAGDAEAIEAFHDLMRDTAQRNHFEVERLSYYHDFMAVFGDDAALLLVHHGGNPVAGVIAASALNEGIAMFAASSTEHRVHGATALLQFEAMRWARARGCVRYDLWGISAEDQPPSVGHVPRSQGGDWRGIDHFKTGFGGDVVTYPPAWQRPIHSARRGSADADGGEAALTIGMATYNDFDGVYFTIQALRLYQDLTDTELLVVDNYGCERTREFVESWAFGRYILATEAVGTAAPRDLVFRAASGDAVLCCDSHIMFAPGAIARLKAYYREHPDCRDLLQGPLVYDDLHNISTHFDPVWRDQMWGTWGTDPRGEDPEGEPFEIPMQGLGVFSCRKDAWPGFNPRFRGFGGEEGYIHEKVRQAGGRCLCLPWLRWVHRFGRPAGEPYPLSVDDKFRNYLIGHAELGLDLRPVFEHFSEHLPEETIQAIATEALGAGRTVARSTGGDAGVADRDASPVPPSAEEGLAPSRRQRVLAGVRDTAPLTRHDAYVPLVSCICLTYNRPPEYQHLLEEAIESFLRQDYPNKELIVLNDCPGQVLECDAPGVRVINVSERFPTLGDKRNAAVGLARGELLAPWDDDDISLPRRLSFSVERLGDADYFNPRRYWFLDNDGLHSDHAMGVGHNASLFTRTAFEVVGGYPSISLGEDAAMDGALLARMERVVDALRGYPELERSEWLYIYRWGVSPVHVSGRADEDFYREICMRPVEEGRFRLYPHWRWDYEAETRRMLERVMDVGLRR